MLDCAVHKKGLIDLRGKEKIITLYVIDAAVRFLTGSAVDMYFYT